MPVPFWCGTTAGFCPWAFSRTVALSNRTRSVAQRAMVFRMGIDLKTFQQGTFGPAAIVNMRVAEEIPVAKNCGVRVKIASKTYPSLCCRLILLFLESCGPDR